MTSSKFSLCNQLTSRCSNVGKQKTSSKYRWTLTDRYLTTTEKDTWMEMPFESNYTRKLHLLLNNQHTRISYLGRMQEKRNKNEREMIGSRDCWVACTVSKRPEDSKRLQFTKTMLENLRQRLDGLVCGNWIVKICSKKNETVTCFQRRHLKLFLFSFEFSLLALPSNAGQK